MRHCYKLILIPFFCIALVLTSGCAPEIGSEKWCAQLKEKPKGEWTANELADYTKHCLF
ncbi:MAG: DUF3012 domain-containing protein [Gammaproteobacteria bacterium]